MEKCIYPYEAYEDTPEGVFFIDKFGHRSNVSSRRKSDLFFSVEGKDGQHINLQLEQMHAPVVYDPVQESFITYDLVSRKLKTTKRHPLLAM